MSVRRLLLAQALVVVASLSAAFGQEAPLVTHGVSSGDVTATSAVIWARSDRPSTMTVELTAEDGASTSADARAGAERDFTAQVVVEGLKPGTRYTYRVRFAEPGGARSAATEGRFRTAPPPTRGASVSFVVGGDLGGQGYCRHADGGYAIFSAMAALEPDFFVANGDMIYADGVCPQQGPEPGWENVPGGFPSIRAPEVDWQDPARLREVFLAHWLYNRADPSFQELLRRVPMYVQWDDHEVINDFGAGWGSWTAELDRAGFGQLVAAGRQAFFDFHPHHPDVDEPGRLYRSYRWGRHLELFLLDARSYRSPNDLADRPDSGKTLLGAPQLHWLEQGLRSSEATWKVVSSDVPLSIPTGSDAHLYGRDAWANGTGADYSSRTGFENELLALMRAIDRHDVRNLVFVATDVHLAANFRYQLDADGDGDLLRFHELVSGPLNAGRSPTLMRLDPTLRPVVLYAEGSIFNFSYVRIEERQPETAVLVAEVRDESGTVRPGSRLEIEPE